MGVVSSRLSRRSGPWGRTPRCADLDLRGSRTLIWSELFQFTLSVAMKTEFRRKSRKIPCKLPTASSRPQVSLVGGGPGLRTV